MPKKEKKEAKRPWLRKSFNFVKWFAVACLATIVLAYGIMRADFVSNANRLPAEIARAKELGIPLESAEMERNVAVADNAAPIYASASKTLGAQPKSVREVQLYDYYSLLGEKDYAAAVRIALAKVGPPLDEVVAASRKPYCEFGVKWNDPPMLISFPVLAKSKENAKWLAFRAYVRAYGGDWDRAIEDAAAIYRLAAHLCQDPTLIGTLVANALDAIASRAFEQLANLAANNSAQLTKLAAAMDSAPSSPSIDFVFRGEAYFGYRMANDLAENWSRDKLSYFEPGFWQSDLKLYTIYPPFIEADLVEKANAARVLAYWNEVFEKTASKSKNPMQFGAVMKTISERTIEDSKRWYGFSEMLFISFDGVGKSIERTRMQRATVRALIDVLQFKVEKGRLPTKLEEMGPVAIDPFSNKPLHYRQTKNGFRVWSRGPDRKGFGGRFEWEYKNPGVRNSDEIVVAYPSSDRSDPIYRGKAMTDWRSKSRSSGP